MTVRQSLLICLKGIKDGVRASFSKHILNLETPPKLLSHSCRRPQIWCYFDFRKFWESNITHIACLFSLQQHIHSWPPNIYNHCSTYRLNALPMGIFGNDIFNQFPNRSAFATLICSSLLCHI